MLEGKEFEGKIGDVGGYSVDVDDKGSVAVAVTVDKDFGVAKVKSVNSVETNIFTLAEQIAAKNGIKWLADATAMLEKLLGIKP